MRIVNRTRAGRSGRRLGWRGLALACACLGWGVLWPGAAGALQPAPGAGTVFLTKVAASPDGAVLTPLDLGLSLYGILSTNLSFPEAVVCVHGKLYVTETFAPESVGGAAGVLVHQQQRVVERDDRTYHRIVRLGQDGSGKVFLIEWDSSTLQPSTVVVSPEGDMYVGTTSLDGERTQGLWRVRGVLAGADLGMPELVLPPERFLFAEVDTGYTIRPMAFLPDGPFAGDLLLIDAPVQSFVPGGRILRAAAPDFDQLAPFVAPFADADTGQPFKPAGLAVAPDGRILVTDFANDKVLAFGLDGTAKGTFATFKSPNQIAVGSDGVVYATNLEFRGRNVQGGLFIFAADGTPLASEESPIFLRGVTVCPPTR